MNNIKDRMSIFGIGPKLFIITSVYSILIIQFNDYSKFNFKITAIPLVYLTVCGIILMVAGILFFIISFITIIKVYKTDRLCIKGVYSICRNPAYSSWLIFIVPGITLFWGSWVFLTIPIVMYFNFRILIKAEETYLQNKFGKQYTDYKNNVSLLFPMFWKYTKEKNIK